MKLRSHQARAQVLGRAIHDGKQAAKVTVAYVTPGGGKTLMAALYAAELIKRVVKQVLVLTPRDSLKRQMVAGFADAKLSLYNGHKKSLTLFREGRSGAVATYQDVATNPRRWLDFVNAKPTLLILDESHHLPAPGATTSEPDEEAGQDDEIGWTRHVVPLVDAAAHVLAMTGSKNRSDKKPIAFLDYSLVDEEKMFSVRYARRDALDEKAIINVAVTMCDGEGTYTYRDQEHTHRLSTAPSKEQARTLNACLDDEVYRSQVLDVAIGEFLRYRDETASAYIGDKHKPRMIVICKTAKMCDAVGKYIAGCGLSVVVATHKIPKAVGKITQFRDHGIGDVLVTCQMAYEGLDIPDCTHLVAFTKYRARPWLEQAMSRSTRFDHRCKLSWEQQKASLYVPADHEMRAFIDEWRNEQPAEFRDPPKTIHATGPRRGSSYSPISGEMTEVAYGDTGGVFSAVDQDRIREIPNHPDFPTAARMAPHERLKLARLVWPNDDDVPTRSGPITPCTAVP
jgi:superfamily II DNA or RNA helicase